MRNFRSPHRIGVLGVIKNYGPSSDPAYVHLLWPVILIGIGRAMLARGQRWRSDKA